jgi:hypothetical protein
MRVFGGGTPLPLVLVLVVVGLLVGVSSAGNTADTPSAMLKYSQMLSSSGFIETKAIVSTYDGTRVLLCGSLLGTAMFDSYVVQSITQSFNQSQSYTGIIVLTHSFV